MEVNGIAHIFLTASNYERSCDFYRKLLPFLGLKPVIDTETTYYCVGGRTAVGIRQPSMKARHSSRSVSVCIISASVPVNAPTSMNCTAF
jgi:hypothetical protein